MTKAQSVKPAQRFMGRLEFGCDLLDELTGFCVRNNIQLGRIEALGAVQKARTGFYDQAARTYQFHSFDKPLEITSLAGNISLKDGKPFVHAHVTLSDENGHTFGGHLAQGTIVFACEFIIDAFDGPPFQRQLDAQTGLPLWK